MRLDHLLSKELLALFGVSRRRFNTECVLPVSSWVEHMTRCRALIVLLSTAFRGLERWVVMVRHMHAVGS